VNSDILQWALKLAISGLLIYAAVEDLRKREVPYVAGISLMLFGAFTLIWDQHWLLVAFYLSAVIGSKGGVWGLLPAVFGLSVLAVPGLMGEAYPFIIAIFFVNMMFGFGAIGEGDAVLAYGLLAIAYESRLWMPLVLLGTSLLGIIPVFWKRSPKEVINRVGDIFQNFGQIEEDEEAVLFPWAVIAAGIGLVYIWFVGGGLL
jgi:Flp pilus assembly protein protease CpaA